MVKKIFTTLASVCIKDMSRIYRIISYKDRIKFWIVIVVQILSAFVESLSIFILALFGISIGAPEIALNSKIAKLIFQIFPKLGLYCSEQRKLILCVAILVFIVILVKNFCNYMSIYLNFSLSESISCHITSENIKKFLYGSYYWHLSQQGNSIISKIMLKESFSIYNTNILNFYNYTASILVIIGALGITEPKLTVSVFSLFGFVSLVIYLFLRKKLDRVSKNVIDFSLAENIDFIAINTCIREIKTFNNEEIFLNRFISRIKKNITKKIFINISSFIPSWLLEVVGFGTILGSIFWLISSNAEIPQIIASISLLLLTAWRVLPIINRAMTSIVSIRGIRQYALVCLDLFDELYNIDTKIQQNNIPFNFENKISLIEVSFKYPLVDDYAIQDISLEITKGETIGLIGPSGSGKSTLALVLSGLVPPIDGRIEVDGKDLTSDRRTALSRQVGFIPQTPVFMDGTVADNVAFSCWGRSYDRQGVVEACKHAAMDFVFENPQGLDWRLSSDGKGLSVGQAQRVAIARALFANPLIIIFDEATSALDQLNENLIQQTMQQMPKDVTKIIIAHRLTTVEICDRLIWLENGRIKEIGPPSIILPLYKCIICNN